MFIDQKLDSVEEQYKNCKLCYIDHIPETIYDYDIFAKKVIENPEFSWDEYYSDKTKYPYLGMCEYPNPDYIENVSELYAYFTSIDLDKQNGDDWDDRPYECNAGWPYTKDKDEKTGKYIEHTVIRIPFVVPSYDYMLPSDYVYDNSPFAIKDINAGAVAWIYVPNYNNPEVLPTCIYAGCTPEEFKRKLDQIHANYPNFGQ